MYIEHLTSAVERYCIQLLLMVKDGLYVWLYICKMLLPTLTKLHQSYTITAGATKFMEDDVKNILQKHLKGITESTLELLTGRVGTISTDKLTTILDASGHLATISLKAAIEYLLVSQEMVKLLDADGLKLWSEAGRRLASHSSEQAIEFFHKSPAQIGTVDEPLRLYALTLLSRQAALSTNMALETLQVLPGSLHRLCKLGIAEEILSISVDISNYSVKHSCDMLRHALRVTEYLYENDSRARLLREAMTLTRAFVKRSGNTAAELFLSLPELLTERNLQHWPELLEYTYTFLERSGGIAMQYFRAASKLLEMIDSEAFELWTQFGLIVTSQGNASGYQFLKVSPRIIGQLTHSSPQRNSALVRTVLETVLQLAQTSSVLAIECFKTSPQVLKTATLEQFREWALNGIKLSSDLRRAQAYYALESQLSRSALNQDGAISLETISYTLRLYIEGLTGRVVALKPVNELTEEQKISDGHTIYLPNSIREFSDYISNFKLYKALAVHAAGQLEFGTFLSGSELAAIDSEIAHNYFDERFLDSINYLSVLSRFPDQQTARRVFTTIENGRIDRHLRHNYRGIRRELDFVKERLLETRPKVTEIPKEMVPYELLFQCAIFGQTSTTARQFFPFAVEFDRVFDRYVTAQATVADSLKATMLIYDLIEKIRESEDAGIESEQIDQKRREEYQREEVTEADKQSMQSLNEPFSYWIPSSEGHKQQVIEQILPSEAEMQERPLEPGDTAFFYDEWDRDLADYRVRWCRVVERRTVGTSTDFVEATKAKYAGVISSIRHQFQLLRPENLLKMAGELDGEDFDLQAVIDYAVDRRTSGRMNERLYTRKLRKQRDVAVSFLLDMSSSTARTISRNQNLPYSRPGQRIIEIEKEGLVLMTEALEAVGDSYSIQGFTSEGRRNVKFYIIKDFDEVYSVDTAKRIGSTTYQNNTRLGAAIRHATARLEKQEARTRLLIILSDGRPYDHDYGDSRYAREDTKVALRQAKAAGIIPFCITIDRESQEQLIDLYGEVGFTIIDDVMSLPERMPAIYRRLTT